jgi:hypothetical protein
MVISDCAHEPHADSLGDPVAGNGGDGKIRPIPCPMRRRSLAQPFTSHSLPHRAGQSESSANQVRDGRPACGMTGRLPTKAVIKRASCPGSIPNPLAFSTSSIERPALRMLTRPLLSPLIAFGLVYSFGASTCADRGRTHRDSQEPCPTIKRPERAIWAGTWIHLTSALFRFFLAWPD